MHDETTPYRTCWLALLRPNRPGKQTGKRTSSVTTRSPIKIAEKNTWQDFGGTESVFLSRL